MAGLLERFSKVAGERRQTAAETYLELLDRADAPKAGDEERLAACLSELGLSPQDVEQHLRARAAVERLQQQVKTEEELTAARQRWAEALKAWQDRTREAMKEIIDRLDPLQLPGAWNYLSTMAGMSVADPVELERKRLDRQAVEAELNAINVDRASADAERKIAELRQANAIAFG